jgi:hypothetical protein
MTIPNGMGIGLVFDGLLKAMCGGLVIHMTHGANAAL